MIELAITLGSIFSLMVYDIFGLAAGGIVVPGYIALELHRPERLLALILVALTTLGATTLLSKVTFLFGRRLLVMSVLIGCLLSQFLRSQGDVSHVVSGHGLEAVGWVIPGLMAYWCSRQGTLRTLSILALTAIMVRLSLILINPEAVFS